LEMALDLTGQFEKKLVMTGRKDGSNSKEFCDYVLEMVNDPELEQKWKSYQS